MVVVVVVVLDDEVLEAGAVPAVEGGPASMLTAALCFRSSEAGPPAFTAAGALIGRPMRAALAPAAGTAALSPIACSSAASNCPLAELEALRGAGPVRPAPTAGDSRGPMPLLELSWALTAPVLMTGPRPVLTALPMEASSRKLLSLSSSVVVVSGSVAVGP